VRIDHESVIVKWLLRDQIASGIAIQNKISETVDTFRQKGIAAWGVSMPRP
jgi:ABC-type transporter MlaC component